MDNILLSLCIPTNGIGEWVFPVLDSIYKQNVNNDVFEVIVTDNGDNEQFQNDMKSFSLQHDNLIYKKTNAYMFHNQLESLKLASGEYLKFINHRLLLDDGSIGYLLKYVENNRDVMPVTYFSNGVFDGVSKKLNNFDEFVSALGRYASWTTGVGIWRKQFENIPSDTRIDKISPHSYILFAERKHSSYIIDDTIFGHEIDIDHSKKGTYDLFKAFGVEEFLITLNLFADGDISAKTVKAIKKDYKKFLCELYFDFIIRRKPCSYKLNGFDDSMGIIFTKKEIILGAYFWGFKKMKDKIKGVL